MPKNVGLRVDVDFEIGLVKGVPFLLDYFSRHNIKATFYVTMGPDGFGHSGKRIKTRGYLKRILNFNPLKIILCLGPAYLLRQFAGIGGNVGSAHPEILKRIIAEGHAIGVHGYDHFWWAENIWDCGEEEIKREISAGLEVFRKSTGIEPVAWASPNWRISEKALMILEKCSFKYGADCRGHSPFFPKFTGWTAKTPQFPITLPCLHEIKNYLDCPTEKNISNEFISKLTAGSNVWCIHCYYEGILERRLFTNILGKLLSEGFNFMPIGDIASKTNLSTLPECGLMRKKLPGGRGEVTFQEAI